MTIEITEYKNVMAWILKNQTPWGVETNDIAIGMNIPIIRVRSIMKKLYESDLVMRKQYGGHYVYRVKRVGE